MLFAAVALASEGRDEWDPDYLQTWPDIHPPQAGTGASSDEIFVVGCGHTGTSIVLRMIGNHPHIHYVAEETCALCDVRISHRLILVGRALAPGEEELTEYARAARRLARVDRQAEAGGFRRWAEKTPHHVHYMRRLFDLRPRARVVLVVRDGRDVVASLKGRTKAEYAARAVSRGIARWKNETSISVAWAAHPRTFLLKYEELVTDTDAVLQRLFTFLGEDYDPSTVRVAHRTAHNGVRAEERPSTESGSEHEKLRAYQISQPLFDGRFRWREPPPRGLTREERTLVRAECSDLLEVLNYSQPGEDWVEA